MLVGRDWVSVSAEPMSDPEQEDGVADEVDALDSGSGEANEPAVPEGMRVRRKRRKRKR